MSKAEYDDTNRGFLMRNYDKERLKNERDTSNWANAQGSINILGMEFYISSWTGVIKSGEHEGDRIQNLQVQPKDEDLRKNYDLKDIGDKLEKFIKQTLDGDMVNNNNNSSPKEDPEDFEDDDIPF